MWLGGGWYEGCKVGGVRAVGEVGGTRGLGRRWELRGLVGGEMRRGLGRGKEVEKKDHYKKIWFGNFYFIAPFLTTQRDGTTSCVIKLARTLERRKRGPQNKEIGLNIYY